MAPDMEIPKDEQNDEIESILAVDCGSVFTKVVLVDKVDGTYRLAACGEALTQAGSSDDVVDGARRAIARITEITGRTFLNGRGYPIVPEQRDGTGVGAIVLTMSAAPPLQVWLAGLVEELSLSSGHRACQSPYVVVNDLLSLMESDRLEDIGELASQLQAMRPDTILVVGGSDQGAERPIRKGVEALALAALSISESTRPLLLYAGNSKLQNLVQEIAKDTFPVQIVENVRPTMDTEQLGPAKDALEARYLEQSDQWDPGFKTLKNWSRQVFQTTARALGHTVRYLALQSSMNVLAVDLGAYITTVASQSGEAFSLSSFPGLGIASWGSDSEPTRKGGPGSHARPHGRVESTPAGSSDRRLERELARWLPEPVEQGEIKEILAGLAVSPFTMAQTSREIQVEQALARERIAQALQRADLPPGREWDLIIGCGGFLAHLPRRSQAALVLLDALQPVGVSILALDPTSLGPALGVIASVSPLAATQVLERDAFLKLGTVVSVVGRGREGGLALQVRVTYENGDSLDVDVRYGSLETIPLPTHERAEMELRPCRGFNLGSNQRQRISHVQADGGVLGVIVDARGRPLRLPTAPEQRQQRVQEWLWALGD